MLCYAMLCCAVLCYAMQYYAGAANSASTGMLVVDSIVPGSFAEGLLEPGDVITRVEGKVVTHFLALEDTLDSSVGATVTLNVERGGQPLQATIKVCLPVLACYCAPGGRLD
jgi:S1-C subfamily serine protease